MMETSIGIHGEYRDLLSSKGIKPSYQRLMILEYIMDKRNHPSAEHVFQDISKHVPTLSRTTVYNNLNLFVKKGILTSIRTQKSEARYDIIEFPHAHFLCSKCQKILDVDLKTPLYQKDLIDGHKVAEVNVQLRGICRQCLEGGKKKDENKV
jgi:Fur family peroxide stress response transcriptional regulator